MIPESRVFQNSWFKDNSHLEEKVWKSKPLLGSNIESQSLLYCDDFPVKIFLTASNASEVDIFLTKALIAKSKLATYIALWEL